MINHIVIIPTIILWKDGIIEAEAETDFRTCVSFLHARASKEIHLPLGDRTCPQDEREKGTMVRKY